MRIEILERIIGAAGIILLFNSSPALVSEELAGKESLKAGDLEVFFEAHEEWEHVMIETERLHLDWGSMMEADSLGRDWSAAIREGEINFRFISGPRGVIHFYELGRSDKMLLMRIKRLPEAHPSAQLKGYMNGCEFGTWETGLEWRLIRAAIPAEFINDEEDVLYFTGLGIAVDWLEVWDAAVIPMDYEQENIRRRAVYQTSASIFSFDLMLPESPRLQFACTVGPDAFKWEDAGFTASISVSSQEEKEIIFRRQFSPAEDNFIGPLLDLSERWHFFNFPLEGYGNKEVRLDFSVEPGPSGCNDFDRFIWAEAKVIGFPSKEGSRDPFKNAILVTADVRPAGGSGVYGDAEARTPEWDALSKRSIVFTEFWNESEGIKEFLHSTFHIVGHNEEKISGEKADGATRWTEKFRKNGIRSIAVMPKTERSYEVMNVAEGFDILWTPRDSSQAPGTFFHKLEGLLQENPYQPFFLWFHISFSLSEIEAIERIEKADELRGYSAYYSYDVQLGEIIDFFDRRGLLSDTMAAVVFWDKNDKSAGENIQETQRDDEPTQDAAIPLLMTGTGKRGIIIDAPLRARDLMPIIGEWLGLSVQGEPEQDKRIKEIKEFFN